MAAAMAVYLPFHPFLSCEFFPPAPSPLSRVPPAREPRVIVIYSLGLLDRGPRSLMCQYAGRGEPPRGDEEDREIE